MGSARIESPLMRKKLAIVAILVGLFLLFIFVRFMFFDAQNSLGRLKIISSPAAKIFIDNVEVGKSPYENANIKAAEYKVKIVPLDGGKNAVSWESHINVYKNTLTYVSRELGTSDITSAGEVLTVVKMKDSPKDNVGEVQIETSPQGAIVYLDSDEKGVAPLVLQDVPAGDHELSVYLPGFFRRAQKIRVQKGYQVDASFKLALDQSHKTLEEELDAKRKEASEEAKKKEEETKKEETSTPSATSAKKLEILETETGYLNVRSEPAVSGDIVTKVNPGKTYSYTEEQNGWYKISVDPETAGWVSGDYVKVQ